MTVMDDFQRMGRILTDVGRLQPAERDWLMRRLAEVECVETKVGKAWTQPAVITWEPEKKRWRP